MFSRLTNYFTGTVFLLFSEGLYDFAIAVYAYQISGKASVGAITYGIGYFAEIVVSLVGGGHLDRHSKMRVFTLSILTKVGIFSGLIYYGNTQSLSEYSLWGFALLIDAIHHFSKLNNMTAVAELFQGPELVKAHGTIAAVQGSSRIISPLLGGALVGWLGPINSLGFCAIFQLSALFFFYLAFRNRPKIQRTGEEKTPATFATLQALIEVWRSPMWRRYFTLDAMTTLISGTSVLLMVPLMK